METCIELGRHKVYHNHNETVMEDLGMFGGDVKVLDGNMNIAGSLKGTIKDLEITNNSALYVKTFEATQKGTFNQSDGGMFYTSNDEKTRLSGLINEAVDERVSKLSEETKRRYQCSYPNDWKTPAALEVGTGLPGGGAAGSIVGGLAFGAAASALGGHHHGGGGGGGIHVGVNQNGQVFAGPSHASLQYQSRQRRKQDLHFESQMRDSANGGYLRHAAPELFRSPLARNTSILKETIKRSKAYVPVNQYDGSRHKNRTKPELQIVNAFNLKIDVSEYTANRNYLSRLKNSLLMAKIPQNDISTIWGDVWFRTVGNWVDVPQQKKLDLIHECWQVYDVQDNIYKGRANLDDYRYLLDTPAERFMDHVAIPLITVGSMFTPATAPVAFSSSARTAAVVVPKLKQIATALGAAEVLEETMTFFSKKAGGSEPSKAGGSDRIQSSKSDLDSFVQKKLDSGICSKWKVVSGRQTYKFNKDAGIFKKGDLITKDTRHYEAEWWSSSGTHKGAVEPIRGPQYKGPDSTKHLDIN